MRRPVQPFILLPEGLFVNICLISAPFWNQPGRQAGRSLKTFTLPNSRQQMKTSGSCLRLTDVKKDEWLSSEAKPPRWPPAGPLLAPCWSAAGRLNSADGGANTPSRDAQSVPVSRLFQLNVRMELK